MKEKVTDYYEALRPAYDELLQWADDVEGSRKSIVHRSAAWLAIGIVPLFLIFLIPVVPYLSTFGPDGKIGPFVVGSDQPLVFLGIWVGGAIILGTTLACLLWLEDRLEAAPPAPPHRLSADQMAFVASYEAAEALRQYFIAFVESHLEKAESAVERLFDADSQYPTLFPTHDDHALLRVDGRLFEVRAADGSLDSPIGASLLPRIFAVESALRLSERAAWIQLSDDSVRRMRALVAIPDKLLPRIRQRTDLPRVHEVSESLTAFLYGFLPDHEARMDPSELAAARVVGLQALDRLTELLDSLSVVREKKASPKPSQRAGALTRFLQNPNPVARFAAWSVVLFALSALLGVVLDAAWDLTGDTLALVVIPTALLGAATLTVLQGPAHIREVPAAQPRKLDVDDQDSESAIERDIGRG